VRNGMEQQKVKKEKENGEKRKKKTQAKLSND
jgi:hypothetical protein